ncbi:hypothetical protein EVAR_44886_1 [Eumeta japonica]|uniref:Uncharacterized protein n=1 Tax=Eumeta variegata TaxID=151549 RepID=A0A4C1XNI5_EUMVA|nr:hypothetical protein EVAR_44886_1 [Eumeta japonica]
MACARGRLKITLLKTITGTFGTGLQVPPILTCIRRIPACEDEVCQRGAGGRETLTLRHPPRPAPAPRGPAAPPTPPVFIGQKKQCTKN